MKKPWFFIGSILLILTCLRPAIAADAPDFAGEYADKKFLGGEAVFQMSIEQRGSKTSVWFSAGYNDGRGSAPEAEGTGSATGKGVFEFTFKDSEGNSGSGTITRSDNGIVVSIKPTHVADPKCLVFYKERISLKRVAKK